MTATRHDRRPTDPADPADFADGTGGTGGTGDASGATGTTGTTGTAQLVAVGALVVGALIHAAAAYGHRAAGADHVAFFVASAVAQAALAVRVTRHWDVRTRAAAALLSVALLGTWLINRTVGLGSLALKEEVGLADALCAATELVVIALAALPSVAPSSPTKRRVSSLIAVSAALTAAIAVPAAARTHDHASTAAVGSISGVWAGSGHVHGALTGNGIVHDTKAACTPSKADVAGADALVAATTLAMRHFDDPNTAVAEGFEPLGFEPNGLYHYINAAYARDADVLRPDHPESIVYGRSLDGSLQPVGVMYMMPTTLEHGPRPGGCLMTWHSHGFPFAKLGEESVEMVHVWTVPVPGGPFAHEAGPDWARLFLKRPVVDPEEINRLFATVETMVRTKKIDILKIADFRVLGQPKAQRCNAVGRAAMKRLQLSATLQQQYCDDLLGADVPGFDTRRGGLGGLFRRTTGG